MFATCLFDVPGLIGLGFRYFFFLLCEKPCAFAQTNHCGFQCFVNIPLQVIHRWFISYKFTSTVFF